MTTNSVTVTASRTAPAQQADQVVFAVYVDSPLDKNLDDILAAFQSAARITLANFSDVRTMQQYSQDGQASVQVLEWGFAVPAALSDLKSTVGVLTALQQNIAKQKNGLSLSFGIQGTRVSAQARNSQPCIVSDLVADARAKAQQMANAAGLSLGSVLAISGSSVTVAPNAAPYDLSCFLTVKFALGGF